ncbi:MAG: hypothetical protein HGA55_03795 [Methanoregulaceae archaeon]|nr:hypothetical protein [Methanoregulaceae archaeon]
MADDKQHGLYSAGDTVTGAFPHTPCEIAGKVMFKDIPYPAQTRSDARS